MTVKRKVAQRFSVVHTRVVFRKAPSLDADMVFVAKKGHTISGDLHTLDSGDQWVCLSEGSLKDHHLTGEAWVLTHGDSAGLGDVPLLRPVHEQVEVLEELLWRMSDERADRVIPLAGALRAARLESGSAFLKAVDTKPGSAALRKTFSEKVGGESHEKIAEFLKIAIEDSRLALKGFPLSLSQTRVGILFTAPHSLPLCREGHSTHQPEAFTQRLAREFAQIVGGAYLTWAQQEEKRALDHYTRHKVPDPTNKDPNFTHQDMLGESPWTRNLNEVRYLFGLGRPCLHVDLHGCKDPTAAGGSHLVVGLRAMEFAGRHGTEELRTVLHKVFSMALRGASVNVSPQRLLTGANEDEWCTLTQQSLSDAGGAWTCAMQLEMSRALRRCLMFDKELRTFMAQAIGFAWALVSCDGDAAATAHALQYWAARCKAFYAKQGGLALFSGAEAEAEAQAYANKQPLDAADADVEDQDDDREEVVVGEATANSEARAPPHATPVHRLESELVAQARAMEKRLELTRSFNLDDRRPTPWDSLMSWLRCSSDLLPARHPEQRYFIAASWSQFEPQEMLWSGTYFVHAATIGRRGFEYFQILLGKNWKQTLYPSVDNATPYDGHKLCGPDREGHGLNWRIGSPLIRGEEKGRHAPKPGDRFRIFLLVDADGAGQQVLWEFLGVTSAGGGPSGPRTPPRVPSSAAQPQSAGADDTRRQEQRGVAQDPEMSVKVHIDRELGLCVDLNVMLGTDVATLKEEIARVDATGQTKPHDFAMRTATGECLPDAAILTDRHLELDVCPLDAK